MSRIPTITNFSYGQDESVLVGLCARARPQGTDDGASRSEEEYDEADGVRAVGRTVRARGKMSGGYIAGWARVVGKRARVPGQ